MGVAVFQQVPSSQDVRAFLGRTMQTVRATPKYVICDRGMEFDNAGFRAWCRNKNIRPRYGAVGQHGSIAVVERFILTLKTYLLGRLAIVPLRRQAFRQELLSFVGWYNEHRPHTTLGGRTPDEVYHRHFPAHRKPRFEPRSRWPRGTPCAKPWALVKGNVGAMLELQVNFYNGRKHLPTVRLERAA